jgi:hypothetical protein
MADAEDSTWCVATKDHHLFLSQEAQPERLVFRSFASAARFATEAEALSRRDWAQQQFDVPSTYPLILVQVSEIEQELHDRQQLLEFNQSIAGLLAAGGGDPHVVELAQLMVMVEDVREIRLRICDPEAGLTRRYMALSNVIAFLDQAIDDVHEDNG